MILRCCSDLEGRTITRLDGTKQVLHLAGARVAPVKSSLREDLLDWLVNPNVALLMLVGGALLIYLEFNTPGTIVPGALGTSDGAAGNLRLEPAARFATQPWCC